MARLREEVRARRVRLKLESASTEFVLRKAETSHSD